MTRWIAPLAAALLLAHAATAHAAPAVPFQRGMTVGEWGPSAYAPKKTRALLRSLRRTYRVDTVTLFVVYMQPGAGSSAVAPGPKTAPTANLVKAIRAARALGLRVVLRPYVERADGGWRGELRPASVTQWFASYRRFMVRYARLAQREKVSGLVVGTEMVSLSGSEAPWRAVVAEVRRRFKGFVTYQANWDEAAAVKWWGALDAISISGYYPLAERAGATLPGLLAGWGRWVAEVQRLQAAFGKPVMFGEIGYRTTDTAAVKPWEISGGATDAAAQRTAYEAALRTWYRVPWFAGFHWWYLAPQSYLVRGREGGDHRPTAATLRGLGRWYRQARGAPR